MAFKFKYEALLSYRRHKKEMAELDLAHCLKKINEVEATIQELSHLCKTTSRTMGILMRSGLDGKDLQNYGEFLTALELNIRKKEEEKAGYEREAEEKRSILIERHKELKILEALKEKQKRKWLSEEERREERNLGELTMMRYRRDFL